MSFSYPRGVPRSLDLRLPFPSFPKIGQSAQKLLSHFFFLSEDARSSTPRKSNDCLWPFSPLPRRCFLIGGNALTSVTFNYRTKWVLFPLNRISILVERLVFLLLLRGKSPPPQSIEESPSFAAELACSFFPLPPPTRTGKDGLSRRYFPPPSPFC